MVRGRIERLERARVKEARSSGVTGVQESGV
jgi:hypothetical protein